MTEILGYYKRERDGNEYIHYIRDGYEHLTNGIHDWSNRDNSDRIQRYMKQLVKVEEIDLKTLKARLNKHLPHSSVGSLLDGEVEKPVDNPQR